MRRDTIKYIKKLGSRHNYNRTNKKYEMSLPNEIVAYILGFLDNVKDICVCRLVCGRFNILIRHIEYPYVMIIWSDYYFAAAINNYKFNTYEIKYRYQVSDLLRIPHSVKNIIFANSFGNSWNDFINLDYFDRARIKQHFGLIGCQNIYFECEMLSCTDIIEDSENFKSRNINLLCIKSLYDECCCYFNGKCCCFTINSQKKRYCSPIIHQRIFNRMHTRADGTEITIGCQEMCYPQVRGRPIRKEPDARAIVTPHLQNLQKQNETIKKYTYRSNLHLQNKSCHKKHSYKKLSY